MHRDGIKVQLYQIIFVFDFKGKKLLRNADAIRLLDENCLALFCVFGSVLSLKRNLQMIFVFMSNRISFHWKSICFTMETNLKP